MLVVIGALRTCRRLPRRAARHRETGCTATKRHVDRAANRQCKERGPGPPRRQTRTNRPPPRGARCRSLPCRPIGDTYSRRELLADHRYEPLHIRPCTTHDRAGVIALWETVFPGRPAAQRAGEGVRREARRARRMLFVATDAESVIGTAMAGYDGHRGWLYTVAVAPGIAGAGSAPPSCAAPSPRCARRAASRSTSRFDPQPCGSRVLRIPRLRGRRTPEHGDAHPLRRPSRGCAIGDRSTEKFGQNQ